MIRGALILLATAGIAAGAVNLYNAHPMEPVVGQGAKDREPWTPPKAAALKPVRIAAPRNGVYSGMIICGGTLDSPATITDLTGDADAIPASAVELRYPTRRCDVAGGPLASQGQRDIFDALAPRPAPAETPQPVLITVHVPAGAKPGEYRGTLTAGGAKARVVVAVVDYLLPAPRDWGMWVSTTQSPATLAIRYGVEPYSDAHFRLLAKSIALQGALGDNVLYVPILGRNMHGEEHGLVHYRQSGEVLTPDFAALERYLDLYVKHCGKPRIVIAYVFDPYIGYVNRTSPSDRFFVRRRQQEVDGRSIYLSVIEAGKLISRKFPRPPVFSSGWKATLDGLTDVLKRRGIDPGVLRLGVGSDSPAPEDLVAFFKKIAPGVRWALHTHGYGRADPRRGDSWTDTNGMVVTYVEYPDPNRKSDVFPETGDPNSAFLRLQTVRDVHRDGSEPAVFRRVPTIAISSSRHRLYVGLARMGLDLWTLSPKALDPRGRRNDGVFNRYPWNGSNRLYRSATYAITAPGPDGPVATLRYEMLREGLQEAEIVRRMCSRVVHGPSRLRSLCEQLDKAREAVKKFGDRGRGKEAKQQVEQLLPRIAKLKAELASPVPDAAKARFEKMMQRRYHALFDDPAPETDWPQLTEQFWTVAAEVLRT